MTLRPEPSWWARARTLREAGLFEQAIAESLGVSRGAVVRALHPERYRAYDDNKTREVSAARAEARARRGHPPYPQHHASPALREAVRLVLEEGKSTAEAALAAGAKLGSLRATLSHIKHGRRRTQERRA